MSNIFLKDCPQCTSSNPIEAVFCRCGYCFDPHQIKNTTESLAHMAHEEEVYLEYLQARITQARADLDTCRIAVSREPGNNTKNAELLLATQALSTAEAEYNAQHAKVQALSNHKNAVRFVRQQAKEASDKLHVKKKKRTTQNITRGMKGKKKKTTSMQKSGASRATTPNQPSTLKQDQPAPARRAGPPLPRPAPTLKRPMPPAPPRPVAPPPLPAEIVRDLEVRHPAAPVSAASTVRPVAVPTPPPPAPRAAQAAAAHPPAGAPPKPALNPNMKECPHCTAILPLQTMNCRCGFNFGGVADLPALNLSTTELASILGALGNLNSPGNR